MFNKTTYQLQLAKQTSMKLENVKKNCINTYGFVADIDKLKHENVREILLDKPISMYFQTIENCLGLKFVLQRKTPKNDIERTLERLQRDIRLKHYYAGENMDDETYIPNLYLPSKWKPPKCPPEMEQMLERFAEEVSKERAILPKKQHSNINQAQHNLLRQMKKHPDFIIWPADKNLGPVIIERKEYIRRAYTDHLNDAVTYKEVPKGIALQREKTLLPLKVKQFFWNKERFQLSEGEQTYFKRLLRQKNRTAQFYLTCKIHKTPWKTRPVVAACGTIIAGLSTWIDYWLQKVAKTVPTYLKDSKILKKDMEKLGKIEKNAIIFTADATSMYTNIDTGHGIDTIAAYLHEFANELPDDLPTDLVVEGLEIVMKNANFQFGEKYYEQISGTSMGTPCACSYATIYYGYHERTKIIPTFGTHLKYFKRFIDDGFGILNIPIENQQTIWKEFEKAWPFGKLEFTFHKSLHKVDFLDLTLEINEKTRQIETSTFQKDMNLYLYLPPHSAHPPGVMKGMVFGCLETLWNQNSKLEDYKKFANLFFNRLLERGHDINSLTEIFLDAAKRFDIRERNNNIGIRRNTDKEENEIASKNRIFLHFEFHPRDISRQKIRDIFERTCLNNDDHNCNINAIPNKHGETLNIQQATVAYTRAKNIRETVTRSKLHLPEK